MEWEWPAPSGAINNRKKRIVTPDNLEPFLLSVLNLANNSEDEMMVGTNTEKDALHEWHSCISFTFKSWCTRKKSSASPWERTL